MLTRPLGLLVGAPQPVAQQPTRGLKRSRSPENSYGDLQQGEDGTYLCQKVRGQRDDALTRLHRRWQTAKAWSATQDNQAWLWW